MIVLDTNVMSEVLRPQPHEAVVTWLNAQAPDTLYHKQDRDPRETLFEFKKRTLVHFAVDTDTVLMTTRLAGHATQFLPFNKGDGGAAGNPADPQGRSYRTAYLWDEVLARDSLLDLLARFLHLQVDEKRDDQGRKVDGERRLQPGMFVARVVGHSMEPGIADGAYCLFAAPVTGSRQGRTVLVQLRDTADPETGQRYTVKRYASEKARAGDSWRHTRITLHATNPAYAPLVLEGVQEDAVQVIAEFIEVLGTEAPERSA